MQFLGKICILATSAGGLAPPPTGNPGPPCCASHNVRLCSSNVDSSPIMDQEKNTFLYSPCIQLRTLWRVSCSDLHYYSAICTCDILHLPILISASHRLVEIWNDIITYRKLVYRRNLLRFGVKTLFLTRTNLHQFFSPFLSHLTFSRETFYFSETFVQTETKPFSSKPWETSLKPCVNYHKAMLLPKGCGNDTFNISSFLPIVAKFTVWHLGREDTKKVMP